MSFDLQASDEQEEDEEVNDEIDCEKSDDKSRSFIQTQYSSNEIQEAQTSEVHSVGFWLNYYNDQLKFKLKRK